MFANVPLVISSTTSAWRFPACVVVPPSRASNFKPTDCAWYRGAVIGVVIAKSAITQSRTEAPTLVLSAANSAPIAFLVRTRFLSRVCDAVPVDCRAWTPMRPPIKVSPSILVKATGVAVGGCSSRSAVGAPMVQR